MQVPAPFEPRAVCRACRRPESVCYCRHVTQLDTRTRIVLLQHPRERDVPIGTARMASLCLPNAELHVGVHWRDSAALARALSDPARPAALLYPGEGAVDVLRHPPAGPVTLVVVDGTWWQTKKVVRENPELAALPRYAFTAPRPSEYRIRKEPDDAYVSTIEALVHVLGVLEGDADRFHALLLPFRAMIDAQLACEARFRNTRSRHVRRPRRAPGRAATLPRQASVRRSRRRSGVRLRRGQRVALWKPRARLGMRRRARALGRSAGRLLKTGETFDMQSLRRGTLSRRRRRFTSACRRRSSRPVAPRLSCTMGGGPSSELRTSSARGAATPPPSLQPWVATCPNSESTCGTWRASLRRAKSGRWTISSPSLERYLRRLLPPDVPTPGSIDPAPQSHS